MKLLIIKHYSKILQHKYAGMMLQNRVASIFNIMGNKKTIYSSRMKHGLFYVVRLEDLVLTHFMALLQLQQSSFLTQVWTVYMTL